MTTRTSPFDHSAIRNALYRTGLTTGEIAFRIDISAIAMQRIVDGADDPGEIRVATVARLANVLGLPVRSLFRAAPGATTPRSGSNTPGRPDSRRRDHGHRRPLL